MSFTPQVTSYDVVHGTFEKWLYMEPNDHEALDVVMCCALDRDFKGDPIWLFLIAPSGDKKSEYARALSGYSRTYSIDRFTRNTMVSGLTEKDEETGMMVPIAGLLEGLDGKVVVIKDLTDILSQREDVRSDIFGQFRAIYDGYYEKGVGTLKHKIRVESTIGLIACCTSVIDKYTKMLNQLGERFICVRMKSNEKLATERAFENAGQEKQMREELEKIVGEFLRGVKVNDTPLSKARMRKIIGIARYIALMRTYVRPEYKNGRIVDYGVPEPEIPTRIAKQLKKLVIILANVRGHTKVEDSDIATLTRVARDTVSLKRRIVVDEMIKSDGIGIASVIANETRLHPNSVKNALTEMTALGIVELRNINPLGKALEAYVFTDLFKDILSYMNGGV